jgi:hypothetical protein
MSQLYTCHVPTITVLFYPGLAVTLQRHSAELVVPSRTGLGGRR